jgi:hypothetical protein
MGIAKGLTVVELKAKNAQSEKEGFKAISFETKLAIGTYNGTSTGLFNELTYISKADKNVKGRINFACCTFEDTDTGVVYDVDVPVDDADIDNCIANQPVEFTVFYPNEDTTQMKRVKMLNVDAVLNEDKKETELPTSLVDLKKYYLDNVGEPYTGTNSLVAIKEAIKVALG